MIKVNGQPLDWMRYEFATRDSEGTIWVWPDVDEAREAAQAEPASVVMMRAVYATKWAETL